MRASSEARKIASQIATLSQEDLGFVIDFAESLRINRGSGNSRDFEKALIPLEDLEWRRRCESLISTPSIQLSGPETVLLALWLSSSYHGFIPIAARTLSEHLGSRNIANLTATLHSLENKLLVVSSRTKEIKGTHKLYALTASGMNRAKELMDGFARTVSLLKKGCGET